MSKKRNAKKAATAPSKKTAADKRKRRSPEDEPDCYRVTVRGPLKDALEQVFEQMQESRKYRRLASSSVHELAKEAMDIGLQHVESELEEEQRSRE